MMHGPKNIKSYFQMFMFKFFLQQTVKTKVFWNMIVW